MANSSVSKTTAEEMLKEQAVEAGAYAPGAEAEAEQVVAALEADEKSDPLRAIKAIAAVEDSARRALLVGRLVALRIPGATRIFIEEQVRGYRYQAQLECMRAAKSVKRNQLLEYSSCVS